MSNNKKIKLLVVDDSAFMRAAIERMLKEEPSIEVIGTAANGKDAVTKTVKLKPDVVTMDVEMPVMDGLHALREIMKICPVPVIMVSSMTQEGARVTLDALDLGAVDYAPKPGAALTTDILKLKQQLIDKVLAAAGASPQKVKLEFSKIPTGVQRDKSIDEKVYRIVCIGASTGGPPAVQKILSMLNPSLKAPVVIAQHMPKAFTAAFATRMNSICGIRVKELVDGEILQNSIAYICPGDYQTRIKPVAENRYKFELTLNSEEQLKYAPCIDTLFFSAASSFQHNTTGVILTGMGEDGARGLKNIKLSGGLTIAQDKATSIIYGMPRAAVEKQAASRVLALDSIAPELELALK